MAAAGASVSAQCVAGQNAEAARLFAQHDWAGVVSLENGKTNRTADEQFEYGMSQAHLGKLDAAQAALAAGAKACPRQERFRVELAGVEFEQKHYPETAKWLQRALRLDGKDQYANDFLGTDYYLMGNVDAALKYWNRVQKPYLDSFELSPNLKVRRLLLDRAFAFSPQALLKQDQWDATQQRLESMGIFPVYHLGLSARPNGHFDSDFEAEERDGFGASWSQALLSTFSGVFYETVYPRYFDIGHEAVNFDGLGRWDSEKRRVRAELSGPIHLLPQWRWQIANDDRNENWEIRRSFTGPAPALGAFNLKWEDLQAGISSIPSARLQWRGGVDVSHRTYHDLYYGSALTPSLVSPGWILKPEGSMDWRILDVPERRFTLVGGGHAELARTWLKAQGNSGHFEKLEGSALAQWFPQQEGDKWELQERVRTGKIFGAAPVDELYVFGMERDTDLWLRGHLATRDGKKGSTPVGNAYFLSNTDVFRRVYSNGLLTVELAPLLDIGKMGAPTSGLSNDQWLFDTGMEARLTVLGTRVVFSYGRDLRTGNNALFGTVVNRMGEPVQ